MKVFTRRVAIASTLLMCIASAPTRAEVLATEMDANAASAPSSSFNSLQEITVTARRLELLGTASTASEGVVDGPGTAADARVSPGSAAGDRPGSDRDPAQRRGQGESVSDARLQPRSRHGSRDICRRHADQPADPCARSGLHGPQLHDPRTRGCDHLHQGAVLRQRRRLRRGRVGAHRLSGCDSRSGIRDRRNAGISAHLRAGSAALGKDSLLAAAGGSAL